MATAKRIHVVLTKRLERPAKDFSEVPLVLGVAICLFLAGCNARNHSDTSSGKETVKPPLPPAANFRPENALKVIRELAPAQSAQPSFTVQGEFESIRRFFQALALDFETAGIQAPRPSEDFFAYKKDVHDLAISHGLFFLIESIPISEELRELNIGLFRIGPYVQSSDLLGEISFKGLHDYRYSQFQKYEVFDIQEVIHPTRAHHLGYTERIPGRGMVILLFPDAIERMAEKIDVPVEAMQRYVMANELGHVYLNDYLLSRAFPERLLGGHRASVVSVKFPIASRALSMVEFHEAFSDLVSAKYGNLEMLTLLDLYDQIRSRELPKAYRFAIAMQDFALGPATQLHAESLSKDSLPIKGVPFPVAKLAVDLRNSPDVAPLFFADYVWNFEERIIPMAEFIANAGRSEIVGGNSSNDHR